MDFNYITIVFLSSLSSASILVIATIGLAVIFGLMGVVNLAHGEFIMFGAYAALFFTKAGIPFPLAILLASLFTAIFGVLVEVLIIARLYGRILDTMLATWGLSMVMYQVIVLMFGTVTAGIGLPQTNFSIGQYSISAYLLMMVPLAIILLFGVYYLLTHTGYGIMARASITEPEIASAMGIKARKLNIITFAFGSGLAGFAGAILLPIVSPAPNMGFVFSVKAFLVVVVAGPLALTGTGVAASTLGMITNITSSIYTSVVGDIVFFVLTIFLLRFFPLGISNKWGFRL